MEFGILFLWHRVNMSSCRMKPWLLWQLQVPLTLVKQFQVLRLNLSDSVVLVRSLELHESAGPEVSDGPRRLCSASRRIQSVTTKCSPVRNEQLLWNIFGNVGVPTLALVKKKYKLSDASLVSSGSDFELFGVSKEEPGTLLAVLGRLL